MKLEIVYQENGVFSTTISHWIYYVYSFLFLFTVKYIYYHAPAVATHEEDAIIQNGAARTAAALEYRCLEDVPLVSFWVVTLNQHNI